MEQQDQSEGMNLEEIIDLCLAQHGFQERLAQLGIQEETLRVFLRQRLANIKLTERPITAIMSFAYNIIHIEQPEIQKRILETLWPE